MSTKAQIGNAALHTILSHERACFNDLFDRHYMRNGSDPTGNYKFVHELFPELYPDVVERWRSANQFAAWAAEEFKKQNGAE